VDSTNDLVWGLLDAGDGDDSDDSAMFDENDASEMMGKPLKLSLSIQKAMGIPKQYGVAVVW